MLRLIPLSLFAFLLCGHTIYAQEYIHAYQQDPEGRPRERNIDMERLFADLRFEPEKGLVKGTVTHHFKNHTADRGFHYVGRA